MLLKSDCQGRQKRATCVCRKITDRNVWLGKFTMLIFELHNHKTAHLMRGAGCCDLHRPFVAKPLRQLSSGWVQGTQEGVQRHGLKLINVLKVKKILYYMLYFGE